MILMVKTHGFPVGFPLNQSNESCLRHSQEPITKRMKLTTVKREEDNYEISDMDPGSKA